MKTTKEFRKRAILTAFCIIILSVSAVAVSQLIQFKTKAVYNHYYTSLKKGDIAEESVISSQSFDIIDYEATALAKEQAGKSVLPRYTISIETGFKMLQLHDGLKKSHKYSSEAIDCAYEILLYLVENGLFDVREISSSISKGFDRVVITNYEQTRGVEDTILLSDVVIPGNLSVWIDSKLILLGNTLSETLISEVHSIVKECAIINANYNAYETEMAAKSASDAVESVVLHVEKGQVFIEKDHVITQQQLDLFLKIAEQKSVSLQDVLRQLLFCILCFSIEYLVFNYFIENDDIHFAAYIVSLTLSVAASFMAVFCFYYISSNSDKISLQALMPVIFGPIFITMLTGKKRIGFIASFLFGTGMCILPGASIETLFYCCFTGCLCVYTTKLVNKRVDSLIQTAVAVLIVGVNCVLFRFTESSEFNGIIYDLISVVAVTVSSVILINVLIPILEKVFNIPTVFRLYELSHGESKILKKLEKEAPGTFAHSRSVAELAQAAAKAVGANALLAKVGGLYHDIGKIEHPEYFTENQSGENKHDDLNPSLSASIIKSHVKVGAEKGKEIGLPKEVVDIIFQHHGNDVISFFYWEAVKDSTEETKDTGEVEKADYSYNAPIPSSVECAIVMLADNVEAISRSITSPSAAQYEKLINQVIFRKIEHGQLKNCKLTMRDFEVISQSFLKTLSAIHHSRIEYPDEEETNEQRNN